MVAGQECLEAKVGSLERWQTDGHGSNGLVLPTCLLTAFLHETSPPCVQLRAQQEELLGLTDELHHFAGLDSDGQAGIRSAAGCWAPLAVLLGASCCAPAPLRVLCCEVMCLCLLPVPAAAEHWRKVGNGEKALLSDPRTHPHCPFILTHQVPPHHTAAAARL